MTLILFHSQKPTKSFLEYVPSGKSSNAFMKFKVPMEQLFQEHPCNHMQLVAGDYVAGLAEVCEKLGIGYKVQDKNLEYERIT